MDPIIIEALLVTGENDRVRVILGSYCLDFDADDLLDCEELPLPGGVKEGSAVAARVTLQPGARLRRLGTSQAYDAVLWEHEQPFALATRPARIFQVDSEMKAREEAFFIARGLKGRRS